MTGCGGSSRSRAAPTWRPSAPWWTGRKRESRVRELSDAELTAAASVLREKEDLAELCALGREAARRTLGERPFDVQLIGTLALLSGHVAEMATGEARPCPVPSPPPGTRCAAAGST